MADFKNILRIEAGFSQYELALGRVRYDLNILILLTYLGIVNSSYAAGVCIWQYYTNCVKNANII